MKSYQIKLNTIADVQQFVSTITNLDGDFDLISGRYIIDAKSILGVLSLDTQKTLELKVYSPTKEIETKLKNFII